MKYIVNTALTTNSDTCNALDGIAAPSNLDTGYVQASNRYYRFFAASVLAANGTSVVIPFGQDPGDPGRWIRQGAPGPAAIIPSQPSNLGSVCSTSAGPDVCSEQLEATAEVDGGVTYVLLEDFIGLSIVAPDGDYVFKLTVILFDSTYNQPTVGEYIGALRIASNAVTALLSVIARIQTTIPDWPDVASTVVNDLEMTFADDMGALPGVPMFVCLYQSFTDPNP